MLEDPSICEFCVAENELRLELQDRGAVISSCPICRELGGRALPTSDRRIQRIFRALIRLHFSEWDYNTHLGGDSLQDVVFASKSIFDLQGRCAELDFEAVFLAMTEDVGWYPESPEDISLGGGHWDGRILQGLRDQRDLSVESVVKDGLERNWFEAEPSVRELVRNLRADISTLVPAGAEFIRGRVGVHARLMKRHCLSPADYGFRYVPYTGTDIDRPPLALASEGRFNRARVSILYLASDAQTAIAELRPHPGHLVSSATFRLSRDIVVADLARQDIRNFLSDARLEDLRTILSIADVLNVPVQPEHRSLYAVTQLFSDALRSEGFDGVMFRSSVGVGTNLTCFASGAFEMVAGSERVHEVVSLQYQLASVPALPNDYDQEEFVKDEDSPLATLLHGMARGR